MKLYDDGKYNICENASLRGSVRVRLPGGMMLHSLNPRTWDLRYGPKVSGLCILHHFGAFFLGNRHVRKKTLGWMTPPYPVLYHISPVANVKSIKEKGLVSENGIIWLTDWLDPCWRKNLKKHHGSEETVCFRIDTARLTESGHPVAIMNSFHEFTTDYVPPECLVSVKRISRKRK